MYARWSTSPHEGLHTQCVFVSGHLNTPCVGSAGNASSIKAKDGSSFYFAMDFPSGCQTPEGFNQSVAVKAPSVLIGGPVSQNGGFISRLNFDFLSVQTLIFKHLQWTAEKKRA